MHKKAIEISSLDPKTKQRISESKGLNVNFGNSTGVAGDHISEPSPAFIRTNSEKVIENKNNAFIVLGRDRPSDRLSGYGGKGDTQAASIDVVVGRMGAGVKSVDKNGKRVYTDPDFQKDAARIYVSQKSNVDEYFGLAEGKVGNSKTKSSVTMKADSVRLVARQGIKLVTGTDEENSQGAPIRQIYGIDLMAGNDDSDMQPLVKGRNLQEMLIAIIDHIDQLNGIVESVIRNQMIINSALLAHTHLVVPSPIGLVASPSVELVTAGAVGIAGMTSEAYASIVSHKINASTLKYNYCVPIGKKYINSKNNNTN